MSFSPTVGEWKLYIKIFACFILVWGLGNIILSFTLHTAWVWSNFFIGLMQIGVGVAGWNATIRHDAKAARVYYLMLVFTTMITIVMSVAFSVIDTAFIQQLCIDKNFSKDECHYTRVFVIVVSVVSISISVVCCSGCIFCARQYYRALAFEAHSSGAVYIVHQQQGYQNLAYRPEVYRAYPHPPPEAE